jgi:ABC-type lipopolysaccharide export system ATPase subunit
MSTQHSLKVTNISKSYSGRNVVSSVSFFVQSGEIVGLLFLKVVLLKEKY